MSSREFSGVDQDLLADYVGGALDGTPEQATVARLIEEDPAWRDAYAALARAVDLVHADLADWAAGSAPEMPLAVADRITAALAGAGPAPLAGDEPADPPLGSPAGESRLAGRAPTVPAQVPGRRAGGTGRPAEGSGRNRGPGRRSRRWARIAGPVALAAASVTAVGFGLSHLVAAGRGGTSVATSSDAAAGSAREGGPTALAAVPFRTSGPARHSGTDYRPEKLSGSPQPLSATDGSGQATTESPQHERLSAAGNLDRLTRPEALESCLHAIGAEHAGGPLTVELIDYASFQGRPALVVTFLDAGGERWAWVSGPECGVPGSDADTRFRTQVG
ncbi:hypothetical protein GA0074695_0430 [Micromonospora viridifaciens]|uniref:Uncharacterized protein n=1 Tax=Micromonospora viridifaciens TaxID=1881 RepID=A0A1C4UEW7_MICVI|nr:hypothetical protein [Micromonospora viridifaciens]SCE70235.1 hypothetical protein GA0074695_0430 [Micromonospora viridifaciens]